jgi:hypothetical protein
MGMINNDVGNPVKPEHRAIKTQDIIKTLLEFYKSESKYKEVLFFDELRVGTGFGNGSEQRIDGWAINLYPSKGYHTVAYEIKVSRHDFQRELKNPLKRRQALLVSKQFYFITPEGLLKPEEIPIECGLKEVFWNSHLQKLEIRTVLDAPLRDISPPSWRFLASIARRIEKLDSLTVADLAVSQNIDD